ncbi:MAG: phosphatidate cytidylyltransferase [Spirochaetales bacterium]
MSNARIRLILFFTAVPLLVAIVLLLPYFQYGAFALLCMGASGLAALELGSMFRNRGIEVSQPAIFLLGILGPVTAYGELLGGWSSSLTPALYILAVSILFAREILTKSESGFSHSLPRMAAYTFVTFYPGMFSSYAVRLTQFQGGGILVLVFLLSAYLNDSFAWVFGMLFGKNNRNILAVSPNKSLVGFACGFLASILVLAGSTLLFPRIFSFSYPAAILFGCIIGITTPVGDLVESVIKRSASVKDSGSLIPGRGGLLDSIDSPLFNAPIFFYLYQWFTGNF